MRAWMMIAVGVVCAVAVLFAVTYDRAQPTPAPPSSPLRPTPTGLPGEKPPGNAMAAALQNGLYCFDLPGAERPALLADVSGGRLRYLERQETRFGPQDFAIAIDLATGATELVEAALDPAIPATPTAPPEVAAAMRNGDRWVQGPVEAFVIRGEPRSQQLIAVAGSHSDPLVTVGPVGWGSAVRMPGGVLGALLVHDTNQDGVQGAGDESDVCLVALALQPLYVEERNAPKRLMPVMPALRDMLLAEGLTLASLRIEDARHRVNVEMKSDPLEEPMDALDQLRRIQLAIVRTTGEARLGLLMTWPGHDRMATAEWREAAQRIVHWLDFADQLLGDHLDCVGGDPDNRSGIPWCERRDEADVLDWQAALRRLRHDAGFVLRPESRMPARGVTHDMGHFEAPRGFSTLEPAERERLSRLLYVEVATHRAHMHRGRPATVAVLDDEGGHWLIDAKGVRPVPKP